jgi:hypothetical protein
MVKNMLYIHNWLTKRKVTSTAHWEKILPRQQKQQKCIKKVAITQGKIRYKKGNNARNKVYYLHNFMPKKFIPANPHKTSLAF